MARRAATYTPPVKPARGLVVSLDGKPGLWQISDKSPTRGHWWLVASDAAAKAHGHFAEAAAPDMNRPDPVTIDR